MKDEPSKLLSLWLISALMVWGVTTTQLLHSNGFKGQFWGKNKVFQESIPALKQENQTKQAISEEKQIILEKVIACESSGRHLASNGELLVGDWHYHHQSYGILQIQKRTFFWLAEKMGRPYLNIENKKDQIEIFLWALENDWAFLWVCYNKIKN